MTDPKLETEQVKAVVGREVVVDLARVYSASDQVALSDEAVALAGELVQITRERQISEVGVVLDFILAIKELSATKQAHLEAVTRCNKTQHALLHAVGYSDNLQAKIARESGAFCSGLFC